MSRNAERSLIIAVVAIAGCSGSGGGAFMPPRSSSTGSESGNVYRRVQRRNGTDEPLLWNDEQEWNPLTLTVDGDITLIDFTP